MSDGFDLRESIELPDMVQIQIQNIRDSESLPDPPVIPRIPDLNTSIPDRIRITSIQKFIESFEYNYTGKPFLQMNKSRGASHIQTCAKKIIQAALPIQCVEAVFLGSYLTATFKDIERVPLSFKSKFGDHVHRHIVLALKHDGKWGAMGISRRSNLMNKSFKFDTIAELVFEYERSYEAVFHKLLTIYIGLPLPHDIFSDQPIKWRAIKIRMYNCDVNDVIEKMNSYTVNMNKMNEYYKREGCLPNVEKKKEGVAEILKHARCNSSTLAKSGTIRRHRSSGMISTDESEGSNE
jgi:hypothetical protein